MRATSFLVGCEAWNEKKVRGPPPTKKESAKRTEVPTYISHRYQLTHLKYAETHCGGLQVFPLYEGLQAPSFCEAEIRTLNQTFAATSML